VTSGIISALDREMIIDSEVMTLLQTDAAVNPGNSGGGLFNMRAELIGVVNAKSTGVDIEGLGFAIPSDIAKAVASDLINYGFVRGRLSAGLELIDVQNAQSARWYRVSQIGLYIISSENNQLRNGDRITAVNGMPVAGLNDYNEVMKDCDIGDTLTITAARGGDFVSADITLSEWRP
jgi:serine protease Do